MTPATLTLSPTSPATAGNRLSLAASFKAALASDVDWETHQRVYLSGSGEHGAASQALLEFHHDLSWGRLLRGANRSGKSTGGAMDMTWLCLGQHPFRTVAPALPVYARILCPEIPTTMDKPHALRDLLRSVVPARYLRGGQWAEAWNNMAHTLWLANGSHIEFVSGAQAANTQASTSHLGVLWIDEECPREHFVENIRALDAPNAVWWMTYFPEQRYAWVRDYHDAVERREIPGVALHTVMMADNRHNLRPGFIEDFASALTPAAERARVAGEYSSGDDLVFGGLEIPTISAEAL